MAKNRTVEEARALRRAELATRPRLRVMTREEFNELFEGAGPPTEDDVPFRFPVRVSLENDRNR